jgi:acetolactate synthase-1/2/3 large subunit
MGMEVGSGIQLKGNSLLPLFLFNKVFIIMKIIISERQQKLIKENHDLYVFSQSTNNIQDILNQIKFTPSSNNKLANFEKEILEFSPQIISPVAPSDEILFGVMEAYYQCHRPLILAGSGVRNEKQIENVRNFAELIGAPIATAWTHDLIESSNPMFAGRPGTIGTRSGNFILQNCDLLIVLGSRLNIRQTGYNLEEFAVNANIIWVDIDSAELKKPFPQAKFKINCSINSFIKKFEALLKPSDVVYTKTEWKNWCTDIRNKYDPKDSDYLDETSETGRINPYHLIPRIVSEVSGPIVVVCGNATACIVPFQTLAIRKQMRMFSNSGSASMGYDIPAAIGAAIASPGETIVCFAGDGSIMMNIQELQSIASRKLNILLVILENGGYLSIKQTQGNFFGQYHGATPESGIDFPRFDKITEAFGIPTKVVGGVDWITTIREVVGLKGPRCIVSKISLSQEFQPRIKSKMSSSGIVTPPLDDMYPHLALEEIELVRKSAREIGEL